MSLTIIGNPLQSKLRASVNSWRLTIRPHARPSLLRICRRRTSSTTSLNTHQLSTTTHRAASDVEQLRQTSLQGKKRKRHLRPIRTLDPAKLSVDDYLDLSSCRSPIVTAVLSAVPSVPTRSTTATRLLPLDGSAGKFPPNTRGFLYYHAPPSGLPLAGEVRFRVTPSADPTSFASGFDLVTERGLRWYLPMYRLDFRSPHDYQRLGLLLLQDGFVSRETFELAVSEPTEDVGKRPRMARLNPLITAFGQEFPLQFHGEFNGTITIVGTKTVQVAALQRLSGHFLYMDGKAVWRSMFQGTLFYNCS